jgi:transposase InsO family protein
MCSFKLSHFLLPSGGSKQLKNEMFYNRKWFGVSIAEFMDILNRYLHWYNEQRIKMSLGAMSPMEHRRSLNLAV